MDDWAETMGDAVKAAFLAGVMAEATKRAKSAGRGAVVATAALTEKAVKKTKRKASAYSKRYGKAFREVAPRFKKKNGSWKTNGFKNAQKAAHKIAKR